MENVEMIKAQTFGIEIEFTGITRQAAAKAIAEYFGTSAYYAGGGYDTWQVTDTQRRCWKVMKDGSITPETRNGSRATDDYKCEFVTPVLNYSDLETLQEVVRVIRKAGGKSNSSCGLHVHVGKDKHNAKSLRNLINLVYSKEELIRQAVQVLPSRFGWCKPVEEVLVQKVNAQKPSSLDRLGDLWYEGFGGRGTHYSQSRYHGLNLHNVWYANTVEFRYFNSTLHAGKVKAYIQFCLAVSAQAILQKSSKAQKAQTENAKYAFRCWLLRLGLNGDEFKTCRLHMMANLEGDSSFRNGRAAC